LFQKVFNMTALRFGRTNLSHTPLIFVNVHVGIGWRQKNPLFFGESSTGVGVLGLTSNAPLQTLTLPVAVNIRASTGAVGVAGVTIDHIGKHGHTIASDNYGNIGAVAEGVAGESTSATSFFGEDNTGVSGSSSARNGVYGSTTRASGLWSGVRGESVNRHGVFGVSTNNDGIRGQSSGGTSSGVFGVSIEPSGYGVDGSNTAALSTGYPASQ
jgi:hypothetical protein